MMVRLPPDMRSFSHDNEARTAGTVQALLSPRRERGEERSNTLSVLTMEYDREGDCFPVNQYQSISGKSGIGRRRRSIGET